MAVPLVIVAVTIAIGVIVAAAAAAAAVVLYFNPAITSMLGQPEHQQQELIISKEVRSGNGYRQVNVSVNGQVLIADIAATDEQIVKGLSVKNTLAENEAMLFVFDHEAEYTFWMRNMKFPIDIIWIDADKTVVHIEHSLQPCRSDLLCPTYKPVDDSLYVLETVSGFAEKHDIAKGTRVEFELSA